MDSFYLSSAFTGFEILNLPRWHFLCRFLCVPRLQRALSCSARCDFAGRRDLAAGSSPGAVLQRAQRSRSPAAWAVQRSEPSRTSVTKARPGLAPLVSAFTVI